MYTNGAVEAWRLFGDASRSLADINAELDVGSDDDDDDPRSMSSTARPTKGPRVCKFIERHCVLGEGDYFGQPVRLRRWQKTYHLQRLTS